MNTVIKFQKRAARSILGKPMETPSVEIFTELKWMMLPDRVRYQKAMLMYKCISSMVFRSETSFPIGTGKIKCTFILLELFEGSSNQINKFFFFQIMG